MKDRPDKQDLIQMIVKKMFKENLNKLDIIEWLEDVEIWNKPYPNSSAKSILKEADEYIRELQKDVAMHTIDDVLTSLTMKMMAAEKRGEHRLAFDIQKEIDKVAGFYKERIDINHEITFKTKWGGK